MGDGVKERCCDVCGKPEQENARLERYIWLHLCPDCLTEEEMYQKASEDCFEAFNREFGR